ncbi:MAG: sigma 54-interacting transcriptional regulator, partial [Nitrospiraceae bacterium]
GVEPRIGKFEEAQGGTLFLDEVGDLSPAAQTKLLRVLQERKLQHVGGRATIPVDVRIIAATNESLEVAIKKGSFRSDLYYRLKVVTIEMPSLRDIPEDIALLANHFLDTYCHSMGKEPKKFTESALRCMLRYPWPGNTRELEHEIKRIVVTTRRTTIGEQDLSDSIRMRDGEEGSSTMGLGRSLKTAVEELEKRMISDALQRCRQNQLQSAKILGLSRQGLIKKMKRYGF